MLPAFFHEYGKDMMKNTETSVTFTLLQICQFSFETPPNITTPRTQTAPKSSENVLWKSYLHKYSPLEPFYILHTK